MKKITTILIFLCAFKINAQAQSNLFIYDLTSTNTSASYTDPNLTVSDITLSNGGAISYLANPSSIYASSWSTSPTFSNTGKYWQFSFGPNSGKQILANTVILYVGRTGAGPQKVQILVSPDNFATPENITDLGPYPINNTTSLDNITIPGLNTYGLITSTVTIRLYGFAASSTGNFKLNNIILTGETSTLPITLSSFTGKSVDQNIQLNWKTASEENNDYFEIKRAADGKQFQAIGKINGAGNSNTFRDYTFIDPNPFSGANYYQLTQHDFDGKTSSSSIIAIQSKIAKAQLSVYASSSAIHISLSSPNQTEGVFQIFDVNGQKLASQTTTIEKGYNTIQFPIALEKGIYLIRYSSEGEILTQKFIR